MNVEVKGIEEIEMNIGKIAAKMEPDVVEEILLRQSILVKDAIVAAAPLGPTGNLKRGIVSKVLNRRGLIFRKSYAPGFVGIDYRIAPHAHLVEFGHLTKMPGKSGRSVRTKHGLRFVPPHPFFRPVWDSMQTSVRTSIEEEIKTNIEGAPG